MNYACKWGLNRHYGHAVGQKMRIVCSYDAYNSWHCADNTIKNVNWDLELRETPLTNSNGSNEKDEKIEKPLIIIEPKLIRYWIAFLFVIFITLFLIIGVIVPVLITGDYASVWPVSDKRTGVKMKLFYIAWGWIACIPYCIPIFNRKKICIYNNRVEVHPYLSKKKFLIYYRNMRVNVHGNYRLTISKISNETKNGPLHFLRIKFIESITFSLRKSNIYDYELINEAMSIIKERASEYNIKPLS